MGFHFFRFNPKKFPLFYFPFLKNLIEYGKLCILFKKKSYFVWFFAIGLYSPPGIGGERATPQFSPLPQSPAAASVPPSISSLEARGQGLGVLR
jgi:hypothetical protein